MVPEKLRPEVKPEKVSDLEWKKSGCDKSPTESHWFVPAAGELKCRFCGKSHVEVWGTGQSSEKGAKETGKAGKHRKRGRPRKDEMKEDLFTSL